MCPTIWNKCWATSHLLWKPRRCCVCSLSLRSGGHRVDVVAAMQQWEVPNREATRQHHLWQPSLSPIVNLYWQKTSAHALCEDTPPLIPPCSTFQQVWISHCRKDKARVLSRVTRDPSSKYLAFRKKARVCVVTQPSQKLLIFSQGVCQHIACFDASKPCWQMPKSARSRDTGRVGWGCEYLLLLNSVSRCVGRVSQMALSCARAMGEQQMWLSFVKSINCTKLYLHNELFAYIPFLNLWIFFPCCKM